MKKERSELKKFFSYFKPHRGMFALDMCCTVLASLIDLAFPYVSRTAMQQLLPQYRYKTFFVVMGIVVLAYLLRAVCYYVITVVGHRVGICVETDMRHDLFNHIQELSFSYFDQNRTGALLSRITNDLFDITELAHHGPEDLLICVLTLAGSLAVMYTIDWRLSLVLTVLLPLTLGFTLSRRGRMMSASREVKKKTAEVNAAVEQSISGIRTAKAFTAEDAEDERFLAANDKYKAAKQGYYGTMGEYMAGMEFSVSIMQVAVMAAGGGLIMAGRLSYIDLVTFTLYVSAFIFPIRRLAQFVEVYTLGASGFQRFLEIMDTEPEIKDAPDAAELTDVRGDIEFQNVSFAYPDTPEIPVLRDVRLHIAPGETLAVVGPSGGGKTTLCQLLPRFYDVTAGAVLLDGRDVRGVTQSSLRRNIGVIQQDVFIFAGSVMENIRYGRPEATDAEVVAAAVRAEIHKEIIAMPEGYDTPVGERGVMLSGGQRQRLAIARVFLKNPPVLILDEATSALDTVTEERIQRSFDELSKGRTTLIIAHRLSTIRKAGRIAVIEKENIVELGTHQELMDKNGAYAALYTAQNQKEEQ